MTPKEDNAIVKNERKIMQKEAELAMSFHESRGKVKGRKGEEEKELFPNKDR